MSVAAEPVELLTQDKRDFEGARARALEPGIEESVQTYHDAEMPAAADDPPPVDPIEDLPIHKVIQLLRSPVPDHTANIRTRTSAARRVQSTHGNRATRQILAGTRALQRQCACGGTCAKCREGRHALQRRSETPVPAQFNGIPATHGVPLDLTTRRPLEAQFGADLGDVRVHTDRQAAESANNLDALAYTAGRDVYFAEGMYAPGSSSGRRLLAHEVAHVIQQDSGKEPTVATKSSHGVKIGAPDDALETEAERKAEEFMSAAQPSGLTEEEERKRQQLTRGAQTLIQRQTPPDVQQPTPAPPDPQPVPVPGAPDSPGTPTTGLSPEDKRRLILAQTILNKVPTLSEADKLTLKNAMPAAAVSQLIQRRDEKEAKKKQDAQDIVVKTPDNGVPDDALKATLDGLKEDIESLEKEISALNQSIVEILGELGTPGETQDDREKNLKTFVTETFPRMFEDRGKAIVMAELTENVKIAQAEANRYRNICTEAGNGDPRQNRDGLRAAATDLVKREIEIAATKDEIRRLDIEKPIAGVDPEIAPRMETLVQGLATKETELRQTRNAYGVQYPILLREDVEASALANASEDEVNELVGGEIQKILEDIERTKNNVTGGSLKIWDLKEPATGLDIVAVTEQDLGIENQPLLTDIISKHVADEKSDAEALNTALTVLTIAATVIATAAGGPLAGALVGGAFGMLQLARDVFTYRELSAASDIALDPDIARMAQEEPSLFWIVLDIAFVMLDASSAKSAIRAMRGPAQALMSGGTVEEFAAQARKIAPDAADRLIDSAERQVAARELTGGAKAVVEEAEGEGRVLARTFTEDGHELRATAQGFERCSPSCPLLRVEFADELAKNPELEQELTAAEAKRLTDAEGAVKLVKAVEAKLLARQMEGVLGKDLVEELAKVGVEPEALRRVLEKGTDIGNVKGRLWDEIFAGEAKKMMGTTAGREALASGKLAPEIASKLEFIPGSKITDTSGRELTDGILGWREGKALHVVNIFEAKAGQRAATQLRVLEERLARIPADDVGEIRKIAEEEFAGLQQKALAAGEEVGITVDQLQQDLLKYRVQKQLGGQVRETIERLDYMQTLKTDVNVPTTIRVDGEELQVVDISGSSRITGVVPKGVKTAGIEKALTTSVKKGGEGLNFHVLPMAMKEQEVDALAQRISDAAKNAKAVK